MYNKKLKERNYQKEETLLYKEALWDLSAIHLKERKVKILPHLYLNFIDSPKWYLQMKILDVQNMNEIIYIYIYNLYVLPEISDCYYMFLYINIIYTLYIIIIY